MTIRRKSKQPRAFSSGASAPRDPRRRPPVTVQSFTLVEVVIALMIVMFVVGNVAAVQGNAIVFSDYGKNSTQASWLARRVMSQVEYYWRTKPFPELETNLVDQKFEDVNDYLYTLEIKEWKFPFVKLLTMAMGGGAPSAEDGEGGDDAKPDASASGMLETVVKQVFGDEPIFMTAHVDVSWSEGATRNSTGLTYLLTNQAKLDAAIIQLKPVYDKLTRPKEPEKRPGTTGAGGPTPAGTGGPGKPRPPGGPGGGGRPPGGGGPGGGDGEGGDGG